MSAKTSANENQGQQLLNSRQQGCDKTGHTLITSKHSTIAHSIQRPANMKDYWFFTNDNSVPL
jgi:hypothetical protein